MGMQEITLQRSGDRPLRFMGQLVSGTVSMAQSGPGKTRWWQLRRYCTEGGHHVIAVGFRSRWDGEVDIDHVLLGADAGAVAAALRALDPLQWATGLRLLQARRSDGGDDVRVSTLRNHWAKAVCELLAAIEPEVLR